MTALATIFLITGAVLIISGVEHVSIVGTVQQLLSGKFIAPRQS